MQIAAHPDTKNTQNHVPLPPSEALVLLAEKDRPIIDRDQIISENQRQLDAKNEQPSAKGQLIKRPEEGLRLAHQKRFGASSGKNPYQGGLFDEAELEQAHEDVGQQLIGLGEPRKPRKKRQGFSGKLPRVQIKLTLSDDEKAGASRTFFAKVKEELDIVPAKAQILEYWQEKAVFDHDDGGQHLATAQRPKHPLGKCLASLQLLAYILIAKYSDGLPLYRPGGILARQGGQVSRSSMARWVIRLAGVFAPLTEHLHQHQPKANYLQADETRIQALKDNGKIATPDKWMWLIRGGPPDQPVVLFHYGASRSQDVPARLLDGYQGVLQTDGYAGYNKACRDNGITRIGCWDHARRKFVEAGKAAPKQAKGNVSKADIALGKIRKLYALEKRIQDLPIEQKTAQRQQQAQPILDGLHQWLQTNRNRLPKDSLAYKAIQYSLDQWDCLTGYIGDGQPNISNALAENAIRPFAIGRKNWLFADTARGAQASATMYSLIETAKANGLGPYAYLHHLLKHIATANTPGQLGRLMPWRMKSKLAQ